MLDTPRLSYRRQLIIDLSMWSLLFLCLFLSLVLREGELFASREFVDEGAGIRLQYPRNWLLENGDDFLFRVADLQNPLYETSMQISTIPIRAESPTNEQTVLYTLSIQYSSSLSNYRLLDFPKQTFENFADLRGIAYSFVSGRSNPLIEQRAVDVRGLDWVVIRRAQAFIISFRVAAEEFEENLPFFLRVIRSLEL